MTVGSEPTRLEFATVRQLRALLRRREVSALELARHALARVDVVGRRLHAVAELMPEHAERDARAADRALRRGSAGPLCGIPYGAKDLLDTAGVPTRWGSPFHRDRIPTADAAVVRRLRGAGAVLVAKLSMIELAGAGGYRSSAASIDGPCLNPWDLRRWSGGSSSGSAASVAAGLLPFSIGSETAGSLVVPAAFCGVTTLRPSFGRVSRQGAMEVAWSFDKLGPLAHLADDCASVLGAVEGRDDLDAATEDVARAHGTGRRAGVLRDGLDQEPACAAVFERALAVLRDLGLRAVDVALPDGPYVDTYVTMMAGETLFAHREHITGPGVETVIDDAQREALRAHSSLPLTDYVKAVRARAGLARGVTDVFQRCDVLLSPTVLTEATRLDDDLLAYRAKRRGGFAFLGAIAGLPAVSVPMGIGPSGLPLGLTLTGPLGSDRAILRIAAGFQRRTDWHRMRPPEACL